MDLRIPFTGQHELERGFPTRRSARSIYDERDLQRAVEAYRFFYPTVSMEGIFNGGREAGIEDGKALMILAAGPRHVVFTANSDTPYASGALDLRAMGPVVIDLPPGFFIGLVDDHHQRWILDMGIPGPDAGQGGKHLVLPPDYDGDVPAGYQIGRSPTYLVSVALRAVPAHGDAGAAMDALRKVKVHPLSDPNAVLPFIDVSQRPLDATPLRWEGNIEFWQRLHAVIEVEPTLEEFRPMYGELAALGIARGVPFAPDDRMRTILELAANIGLDQMRVEAFASERSDRLVWDDRLWEWIGLVPDDANFEREDFLDLEASDRWFFQAIVTSPAMFRRKEGTGSIYFLSARDASGAYLDGGTSYSLTVPQPVPAKLFWSVTAYDAETRSQVNARQDKAVLGSLSTAFEANAEGDVELFFGPTAPEGKEEQWIETVPERGFFLYFRLYGPEAESLNGAWRLGDIRRI